MKSKARMPGKGGSKQEPSLAAPIRALRRVLEVVGEGPQRE